MKIISYRLGLSWLLITAVSGLQWLGPQETISATTTADWTPVPTGTAEDLAHRLFNREGSYPANLLGWQGPKHEGAYCGDESYVVYVTDIEMVGCCSSGGSCDAVYTSCIDTRSPSPKGPSVLGVMTCSSLCYRNTYQNGYHQYGCGSYSIGQNVVTSFDGSNPQLSMAIVLTAGVLKERTDPIGSTATSGSIKTSTREIVGLGSSEVSSALISVSSATVREDTTKSSLSTTRNLPSSSLTVGTSTAITSSAAASSTTTATSGSGVPIPGPEGISTGALIAIGIVAAVFAIITIALLAFCVYRRRQKELKKEQGFLSTYTDGNNPPVAQHDQPIMGTRRNPTELYQDPPMQSNEAQYQHSPGPATPSPQYVRDSSNTNSLAPSYELYPANAPIQHMSPQSTVSSPTFRSSSPHPSNLTPDPTISQYSHMYELPTDRAIRVTELDSSQGQRPVMHASYSGV